MWGLETEPQSKLILIDGHFILVTRWEDQREKTLMIIMIMGIFSMSENIILSLKFYLVFFIFLKNFFEKLKFIFVKVKGWKCLLVRLNVSRLSIIHSRSKFNFLKQFLCQGERFREISFFLYVLGNNMYKRICPNLNRQFCSFATKWCLGIDLLRVSQQILLTNLLLQLNHFHLHSW